MNVTKTFYFGGWYEVVIINEEIVNIVEHSSTNTFTHFWYRCTDETQTLLLTKLIKFDSAKFENMMNYIK